MGKKGKGKGKGGKGKGKKGNEKHDYINARICKFTRGGVIKYGKNCYNTLFCNRKLQ